MASKNSKSSKKRKNLVKAIEAVEESLLYSSTMKIEFDGSLEVDFDGLDAKIRKIAMAKLKEALPKTEPALASALNAAIASPSWEWAGGRRDIVDTGALKNSLQIEWRGMRAIVGYNQPYAAIVHEGGYIKPYGNTAAAPVYLPGRPWVKSVLIGGGPVPQFDWEAAIRAVL